MRQIQNLRWRCEGMARVLVAGALLLFLAVATGALSVAHAASICVGGGGCYATIQQAVTAAASGDTININAGTYTEHDIALNKNLTLKGASAATTIVDANQLGRAFSIGVGTQVTIRDLMIQNGKVQNDNGGAINNLGTLTLANCAFKSNLVEGPNKGGGAVFSKTTLNVTDCLFESNTHSETFTGPNSPPAAPNADGAFGGGAILSQGGLSVANSTFRLNSASPLGTLTGSGGGIFGQAALNITNSTFDQNQAGCGGGVDNAGTGTISGSTFTKNVGTHWGGGAIKNDGSVVINSSTFSENQTPIKGGAIMHGGDMLTVNGSTFSKNKGILGGAPPGGVAGALMLFANADINNSTFSENTALGDGGAIKIGGDSDPMFVRITSTAFTNNQSGRKGGAIEITAAGGNLATVTITGGSLNNNQARDGGAIYADIGSLTLQGVTLNNNAALAPQMAGGGAIFSGNILNLQSDTFSGNYVDPNNGNGPLSIRQPAGFLAGGGAVFITKTATINNSTFIGNQVRNDMNYNGGAIINLGTLTLTQSRFLSNQAGQSLMWATGGGVSNHAQLNGSFNTFQQNQAGCGGAIYNEEVMNLTDSTFSANQAFTWGGGAIINGGSAVINKSTFTSNQVQYTGGAILNFTDLQVTNSTFANNQAQGSYGAIYNKEGATTITHGTFYQNTAVDNGGAIGIAHITDTVRIYNSLFVGNAANAGATCYLPWNLASSVANIATDGSCGAGVSVRSPQQILLGALGFWGGATQTIPLLAGSVAIDAASAQYLPGTDQRGVRRPQGALGDVGAFEYAVPSEVPEGDTLVLLAGGLGGVATWLRWQWKKRNPRRGA